MSWTWGANSSRTEVTLPEEGPAKILADLASTFRDTAVRHKALLFEDAAQAYAVQEDLARQAFRPIAELAMAKVGLPACIVNPEVEVRSAAVDAPADDFRMLKIATESAAGYSPGVADQLWGFWKERSARGGMRPYVAYLNGAPQ